MTSASEPACDANVLATAYAITNTEKSTQRVSLPMPLPCITILVHGVNDVGEAYAAQERGLCVGLNARLNRSFELGPDHRADLVAAAYAMPPTTPEEVKKEGIQSDPDAVYFRRSANRKSWSPVVSFYWGSSESDGNDPHTGEPYIKKDNWHGQWTDRYGNRLDKNGAKNGGPFANATTNLNAMWGEGFSGELAHSKSLAGMAGDPLHNLKTACPRLYMLLAAKRLAMLIKIIRNNASHKNVAINLLCHSQGCMVALTAHAMLAAEGGKHGADTLILQDPPYSLEETLLEFYDGITGDAQQTTQSRIKTLSNIVRYIHDKKASTPALADLEFRDGMSHAVAGKHWKCGPGAQQWVDGKTHTFHERDNRGKVYLYFCPHDTTVGLKNVQGIGWNGVPDHVKATPDVRLTPDISGFITDALNRHPEVNLDALRTLGEGFRQRIFTSREVNKQVLLVGAPPGRYEMRSTSGIWPMDEENSTSGNWAPKTQQIARGATRQITGEELFPPVRAALTMGEAGHAERLGVSPIDAAIAIGAGEQAFRTSTYVGPDFRTGARNGALPMTADEKRLLEEHLPSQKRGSGANSDDDRLRVVSVQIDKGALICVYTVETPNEARARWQNATDKNSYHSAIPGNPAHAAGVTAYDLSLGQPLPLRTDEKLYMDYLRAVADWRTNWKGMGNSDNSNVRNILECRAKELTVGAVALIKANNTYYTTGVLPPDIAKDDEAVLARPKLIVSQTVAERKRGLSLD